MRYRSISLYSGSRSFWTKSFRVYSFLSIINKLVEGPSPRIEGRPVTSWNVKKGWIGRINNSIILSFLNFVIPYQIQLCGYLHQKKKLYIMWHINNLLLDITSKEVYFPIIYWTMVKCRWGQLMCGLYAVYTVWNRV